MGSNAKKKTTMAKLNRERKLQEKRMAKEARKVARKQAAADKSELPSDQFSADLPNDQLSASNG